MKKDPSKYKWYAYASKRPAHIKTDHADLDFSLTKGEKFGVKVNRGSYFLVDETDLTAQFKLKPEDAERILKRSQGWSGLIDGVQVQAGEEGTFEAAKKDASGYKELETTSAVLKRIQYNKEEKTLVITFPNGDTWAYYDVTPSEANQVEKAPSQGRYFNKAIKNVKASKMLESATLVTKPNKQPPAKVSPVADGVPASSALSPEQKQTLKRGTRIVVNMGDGTYHLATITTSRKGSVHVVFDDGDKGVLDHPAADIQGLANPKLKRKTAFKESELAKYISE